MPDIPNWAWHEYGQRVGFWRLKAIFDDFGVAGSLVMNASVCDAYPSDRGRLPGLWLGRRRPRLRPEGAAGHPDQREMIQRAYQRIRDYTGKPPRGWLSPALAETHDTVDWLHEAGFEYVADWVLDDQPLDLRTRHGRLVACPTLRS